MSLCFLLVGQVVGNLQRVGNPLLRSAGCQPARRMPEAAEKLFGEPRGRQAKACPTSQIDILQARWGMLQLAKRVFQQPPAILPHIRNCESMNISEPFIRKPVATTLLVVAICSLARRPIGCSRCRRCRRWSFRRFP